ncbi:MAG: DUF2461 domain-containing protein [Bacteroidota bacterium]
MQPEFDELIFPPFEGFPKEGIAFLKKLKRNNDREWFAAHKEEFEETVKFPMQCLIATLEPLFAGFAPEFDVNPKKSLFRIYRDTRFSRDKTPYKTHIAAHFELRRKPRIMDGAGFYLHIEPGEVFLGGGIYMPDNDQLKKIRRAVSGHSKEFLAVIASPKFKKHFGTIQGSKLSRPPKGFSVDDPMIEYLKLKQFFAGVEWKEETCYKKDFAGRIASVSKEITPFINFLNEAMT